MDLARHRLETIWQEKTTRETSQAVERRPGQILERHDMTEDSTRQGHLEMTCWGLRPTTGHNGCLMMMMTGLLCLEIPPPVVFSTLTEHSLHWQSAFLVPYSSTCVHITTRQDKFGLGLFPVSQFAIVADWDRNYISDLATGQSACGVRVEMCVNLHLISVKAQSWPRAQSGLSILSPISKLLIYFIAMDSCLSHSRF